VSSVIHPAGLPIETSAIEVLRRPLESALRSAIRVNDATSHVTAHRDGVAQRAHGQLGLHPRVDRVADDPVGVDVLDRAEVELALAGAVLGDVGQPQLVRSTGGEVALDQVVVDRRAGLLALPALLLAEGAPPAVVRTDPPRRPLRHQHAGVAGLVDQKPVTELRVVAVGVEQRVGPVGLLELGIGDRLLEPAVVGLAGQPEHPARHRHGHPDRGVLGGQLADEGVHHFPGRFA
jgi:hypothetical protein